MNIYTSSLPLSNQLNAYNNQLSKVNTQRQEATSSQKMKMLGQPRGSDLSMHELELSPMPMLAEAEGLDPSAEGVPVMKIGLNDPDKKSVVMSRTEFSAADLGEGVENPSKPSTKRKKKSRQAKKDKSQSQYRNANMINKQSGMQDSIIDEVNEENHQSKPHLNSFLKLNEESVNVDIDTSNQNESALRHMGSGSKNGLEDQIETLESNRDVKKMQLNEDSQLTSQPIIRTDG